jgi:hypothetical protein
LNPSLPAFFGWAGTQRKVLPLTAPAPFLNVAHSPSRQPLGFGLAWGLSILLLSAWVAQAGEARCIVAELYLVGEAPQQQADEQRIASFLENHPGIVLRKYVVPDDDTASQRYQAVCKYYSLEPDEQQAIFYACNRPVLITGDSQQLKASLENVFRCQLFVKKGCSRCAQAKPWVTRFLREFPALRLEMRDVVEEPAARSEIADLSRRYRTAAAGFPVLHYCNQLSVGWDSEQSTGKRIENVLKKWSVRCPDAAPEQQSRRPPRREMTLAVQRAFTTLQPAHLSGVISLVNRSPHQVTPVVAALRARGVPREREPPPEEPGPLPIGEPPGPADGLDSEAPAANEASDESPDDSIFLPLLGPIRVSQFGLPLFTIVVGLIDGFNPCAMWVLLFLLSVLVNLKNRAKMLAVAGTFVIVSGVAYFAFIAAWLNLLEWVGLLRPVQITLALLAIVIGSIHVKDFFAFHRGLTLSIPESAKPGIYARVRRIVMAERIGTAIAGAIVLAVLVNFIELLCTAGLPAMYSQILTMQGLPPWQEYFYLGLYILAYMFDDTLMVIAVITTLGHPKMQEKHGRWLKLLSGAVVLGLGIVMLVRPEWLG